MVTIVVNMIFVFVCEYNNDPGDGGVKKATGAQNSVNCFFAYSDNDNDYFHLSMITNTLMTTVVIVVINRVRKWLRMMPIDLVQSNPWEKHTRRRVKEWVKDNVSRRGEDGILWGRWNADYTLHRSHWER